MLITATFEPEFDSFYSSISDSFLDLDGIGTKKIDVGQMSHDYFTEKLSNITIDTNANANENKSPNNYTAEITKGILKLEGYYLLWRYAKRRFGIERANDLLKSIWEGDLYFHDASGPGIQQPYCLAYSTTPVMLDGRPYGQLHSLPPKRADSFMAQVIETTMDLSQEFVGAISPADLLVNYSYYAKKDDLSDYEIVNDFQKFVHVVNNAFRVGSQSPFTNISLFDIPNLKAVFEHYVYPDGSKPDFDYIMHIQKLVGEWFAKGDPSSGVAYRFPVVTCNIMVKDGEILDKKFLDWVAENNIKRACFNIYINDGYKIATCCRLSNNIQEMRKKRADTFGNGGINIGSSRVVTINLPRIARIANGNQEVFFELLSDVVTKTKDLLIIHREEILQRRINQGFLKFFKPLGWFNLGMFFNTIGVVGIYEMTKFMGLDILTVEGQEFVKNVLTVLDAYADKFSEETGWAFNVEEIPAEQAAVTLAKKDKVYFGDNPYELYSNQYIPLIEDVDLATRIIISGKFLELTSGGGILHLNIEDEIKNPYQMKKLIENCVRAGVTHFAINYGYIICNDCNQTTIGGNKPVCPKCGSKNIDYLTRVIGYYSRVSAWNPVRKQYEFPRRKFK